MDIIAHQTDFAFSDSDLLINKNIFSWQMDDLQSEKPIEVNEDDFEQIFLDLLDDSSFSSNSNSSSNKTSKSKSLKSQYLSVKKSRPFKSSRISQSRLLGKIVKQDIRRNYGLMFLNVLNSHDTKLLESFLTVYGVPNVTIQNHDKVSNLPNKVSIVKGIPQIVQYMSTEMERAPDHILRFHNNRILIRSDKTATITSFTKFAGTFIIYDDNKINKKDSKNRNIGFQKPKCISLVLYGATSIQVDANNRINLVEFFINKQEQ